MISGSARSLALVTPDDDPWLGNECPDLSDQLERAPRRKKAEP
jgi:hypothetical protein